MKNRQWVRLNKHVRLEVVPYTSQAPDVWVRVNERLANGSHTKKEESYFIGLENIPAAIELLEKALADYERQQQTGETQ